MTHLSKGQTLFFYIYFRWKSGIYFLQALAIRIWGHLPSTGTFHQNLRVSIFCRYFSSESEGNNIIFLRQSFFYIRIWAKSLERSPAVGYFYGTRIEIWAGFGPVRQLLRPVFSCFHEQKFFLKNILDGENIFGIEWN